MRFHEPGLPTKGRAITRARFSRSHRRRAASQMRVYLQESPNGQYAEQMKKDLEQIKNAPANEAAAEIPAAPDKPNDTPADR